MQLDGTTLNSCPACGLAVELDDLLWQTDCSCPGCACRLRFVHRCDGRVVVLTFLPAFAHINEAYRLDDMAHLVAEGMRIVLNLSCLDYMPSLVLAALISLAARPLPPAAPFACAGFPPLPWTCFATQLEKLFDVYPDEQSALANF